MTAEATLAVWILSIIAGALAGTSREATLEGVLAGLLLGPIGVLAMIGYDGRRQCPQCKSRYSHDAKICPGCCCPLP